MTNEQIANFQFGSPHGFRSECISSRQFPHPREKRKLTIHETSDTIWVVHSGSRNSASMNCYWVNKLKDFLRGMSKVWPDSRKYNLIEIHINLLKDEPINNDIGHRIQAVRNILSGRRSSAHEQNYRNFRKPLGFIDSTSQKVIGSPVNMPTRSNYTSLA